MAEKKKHSIIHDPLITWIDKILGWTYLAATGTGLVNNYYKYIE